MQSQTFEPSAWKPEYAGFGSRLVAFGLDLILANVALLPFRFAFLMITLITGLDVLDRSILFRYSFIDLFCSVAIAAYFVLMTYLCGRTLGKMALQLSVVPVGKRRRNFADILYRETIGRYLSSLLFIGYLMSAFHPEKASLHDRLGNTRVIHGKPVVPVTDKEVIQILVPAEIPTEMQVESPAEEQREEPIDVPTEIQSEDLASEPEAFD